MSQEMFVMVLLLLGAFFAFGISLTCIKSLSFNNKRLLKRYKKYFKKHYKLQKSFEELSNEYKSDHNELFGLTLQQQNEQLNLKSNITDLEDKRDHLSKENKKLQNKNKVLQQDIKEFEDLYDDRSKKIESLQTKIELLSNDLSEYEEEHSSVSNKNSKLQEKVSQLENEKSELLQKIDKILDELERRREFTYDPEYGNDVTYVEHQELRKKINQQRKEDELYNKEQELKSKEYLNEVKEDRHQRNQQLLKMEHLLEKLEMHYENKSNLQEHDRKVIELFDKQERDRLRDFFNNKIDTIKSESDLKLKLEQYLREVDNRMSDMELKQKDKEMEFKLLINEKDKEYLNKFHEQEVKRIKTKEEAEKRLLEMEKVMEIFHNNFENMAKIMDKNNEKVERELQIFDKIYTSMRKEFDTYADKLMSETRLLYKERLNDINKKYFETELLNLKSTVAQGLQDREKAVEAISSLDFSIRNVKRKMYNTEKMEYKPQWVKAHYRDSKNYLNQLQSERRRLARKVEEFDNV